MRVALMSKPTTFAMLAELHGQWQAHVTEADDGEFDVRNIFQDAHEIESTRRRKSAASVRFSAEAIAALT